MEDNQSSSSAKIFIALGAISAIPIILWTTFPKDSAVLADQKSQAENQDLTKKKCNVPHLKCKENLKGVSHSQAVEQALPVHATIAHSSTRKQESSPPCNGSVACLSKDNQMINCNGKYFLDFPWSLRKFRKFLKAKSTLIAVALMITALLSGIIALTSSKYSTYFDNEIMYLPHVTESRKQFLRFRVWSIICSLVLVTMNSIALISEAKPWLANLMRIVFIFVPPFTLCTSPNEFGMFLYVLSVISVSLFKLRKCKCATAKDGFLLGLLLLSLFAIGDSVYGADDSRYFMKLLPVGPFNIHVDPGFKRIFAGHSICCLALHFLQ